MTDLLLAAATATIAYNGDDAYHRAVLGDVLQARLLEAGFARAPDSGGEACYERAVEGTQIVLRVYTSCQQRADGGLLARVSGGDAIRVVTLFRRRMDRGIGSETRVNRVGNVFSIAERMVQRARDAWRAARALPLCSCGAPRVISKAGKNYCSDRCWLPDEKRFEAPRSRVQGGMRPNYWGSRGWSGY